MKMKNKINKAILFAVKKHRNQFRKGTDLPYIVHPLSVMICLVEMGASEDAIIGGVLHDTLEDTNTSYMELKWKFGKKVADIVKSCSENKSLSWKERKQETIVKLMYPPMEDVFMVELADKLCNLRDIHRERWGIGFWKRFKVSKKSLGWYYGGLCESIKCHTKQIGKFQKECEEFSRKYKEVFE